MSRDFNGSSQFGAVNTNVTPTLPYTIAGWVRFDTLPSSGNYRDAIGTRSSGGGFVSGAWTLEQDGDDGNFKFWIFNDGNWEAAVPSNAAMSAGVWMHVALIVTSASHRRLVIDGDWASSGVHSVSAPTPTLDRLFFAALDDGPTQPMDGQMAQWAVWHAALRQDQVEALAAGHNPRQIAPWSIAHYWSLDGGGTDNQDQIGSATMSYNGSPSAGGSDPSVRTTFSTSGSRSFDGAEDKLETNSWFGNIGYPFTVAGWFRWNGDTTNNQRLVFAISTDGVAAGYSAWIDGASAPWYLSQEMWGIGGGSWLENENTNHAIAVNKWHHFAAIYTSATSRTLVINGDWANRTTDTASGSFVDLRDFHLGTDNSGSQDFGGQKSHYAIWQAALTQTQVEALANGAHPRNVGAPLSAWDLAGSASPEPDGAGSRPLTVTGATQSTTEYPRITPYAAPAAAGPAFRRSHIMQLIMAGH